VSAGWDPEAINVDVVPSSMAKLRHYKLPWLLDRPDTIAWQFRVNVRQTTRHSKIRPNKNTSPDRQEYTNQPYQTNAVVRGSLRLTCRPKRGAWCYVQEFASASDGAAYVSEVWPVTVLRARPRYNEQPSQPLPPTPLRPR
jgi:hypothetical protein